MTEFINDHLPAIIVGILFSGYLLGKATQLYFWLWERRHRAQQRERIAHIQKLAHEIFMSPTERAERARDAEREANEHRTVDIEARFVDPKFPLIK